MQETYFACEFSSHLGDHHVSGHIRIESLPEAGGGLSLFVSMRPHATAEKTLKMGPLYVFNPPSCSHQKDLFFFTELIFFPIFLLISLSC